MTIRAILLAAAVALIAASASATDDYAVLRQRMVEEVRADALTVRPDGEDRDLDPRVYAVMGRVPRHLFVPPEQRRFAYHNRPLPIGYGQTISQPFIVALMTDLLALEPGDSVLEVGTGSGYQAAVLAELGVEVYSIEIIEGLGREVRQRLDDLGYGRIRTKIGDGYYGWDTFAPFDAIIVTAAASHIPPPLVQQLGIGGRMVIPVGGHFLIQYLMLVERLDAEQVKVWQLLPVRFVPLTGGH